MKLQVLLPTEVLIEEPVTRVLAEAPNGHFCLLPRHIDFLSILVPGLLTYFDAEKREKFLAVGEGVLVKRGPLVRVSVREAIAGGELGELRRLVEERLAHHDEQEKRTRSAMNRLETELVRRFIELEP